ncbi:hypothetical protein H310_14529 [Aphanomyces invadans]|uniref:CRAL-TRIO domain-containing protein n=1 Tax=Aphanomyces invadans TaxID=157072 RepID=A0A024T9B1_9STRA|nr:hypothetical protein H310_14529 [Aphanomyces invadans]ETV90740.1 hypothetical protein H310_14529 [Aphanomyces invadans]|eukprot:XP_008880630.1 hypothetical protein H310_14529 [Aphanomyces invadans]
MKVLNLTGAPSPLHNMDESAPLDVADQPFYDAIKAAHGDNVSNEFCIRLARAYRGEKKHRMEKTLAEVKRIMEWRTQHGADGILNVPLDKATLFHQCWPSAVYGEDTAGHVINMERLVEINVDSFHANFTVDEILRHRMKHLERIQAELGASSKRKGKLVYKHIYIFDLAGMAWKHVAPSVMSYLKPIFDLGQVYYPESLFRMYLVNAPFVFWGTWKVVSSFIDPETRQKIQIYKSSAAFVAEAQKQGLSLDAIPKLLGGNHPGRAIADFDVPIDAPSAPESIVPVCPEVVAVPT